jgi:hypothetical protein
MLQQHAAAAAVLQLSATYQGCRKNPRGFSSFGLMVWKQLEKTLTK